MHTSARRFAVTALSALAASVFLFVGWVSAGLSAGDATPSAYAYLPAIYKLHPTPTFTPTPTVTPGITGQLTLCNPQQTYHVGDKVCVIETLQNNYPYTVTYGYLGVSVAGPQNWFQTSWSGDLKIGPGCTGPTDTCGGPWQDDIRGPAPYDGFPAAGNYTLLLSVCFGTQSACNWQEFPPGISITVVP
jgi:hypothetical protein